MTLFGHHIEVGWFIVLAIGLSTYCIVVALDVVATNARQAADNLSSLERKLAEVDHRLSEPWDYRLPYGLLEDISDALKSHRRVGADVES